MFVREQCPTALLIFKSSVKFSSPRCSLDHSSWKEITGGMLQILQYFHLFLRSNETKAQASSHPRKKLSC